MSPLKKYLPKGLYWRSYLIILLPIAIMQTLVVFSFFEEHWQATTARLSEGVAGDVAFLVRIHEDAPEEFPQWAARAEEATQISAVISRGEELPDNVRSSFFSALDRALRRALAGRLDQPFWFDTTRYPNHVDIRVQVDEGVMRIIARRDQVFAPTGYIFLVWLFGATVILALVSILFIKNQVRPIERLAQAAEEFGMGRDPERFKPAGASEVRRAALAFIQMRQRIRRHLEQRTALLASVSHDLRTPLTRLKLQLALMPEGPAREAARKDVKEMEAMLEEYLSFAKGQGVEDAAPADLAALLRQAADDAARGGMDVAVEGSDEVSAPVRELAIKRAVGNLIANAAAHADTVRLSLKAGEGAVEILIDDDGPGIPQDMREEAFTPFNRLDPARNQNRNGVGLGLAIARDIARGHGGDLYLDDSPLGGLRAVVRLPV
ncbi:ATP-binding protein [Euryhalocaulis caribicus]|uniref:ATP-binding protein n=1 Tax=Euryhalocaulis caribicus TaxID=1161401 RepID=UPI0003A92F82|nr:ATP-binding protein [Euryhalocaulis caribicus]